MGRPPAMARVPNRILPGVKGPRNQKCVRYDNKRRDKFKVYASFGSENSIIMMFFHCFIKCYECKARGNPESDGLKKFPELQNVIKEFLPVKPLPADFENRSEADKISALAKLASDQAKEAAGIYERNQAAFLRVDNQANTEPSSVPLNGGCGSGNQLDNPEGRPTLFSVQQLIDMLFNKLERRASSYFEPSLMLQVVKSDLMDWLTDFEMQERLGVDSRSSPDGTLAQGAGWGASHPQDCGEDMVGAMEEGDAVGLPDVATSLEDVPRLTGRKRANEGDVYPRVYNGDEDIVRQQPMKRLMENPMLPSPLGSQLEGSGIHGGGENVRSPVSQILDESGEKQLQLFDPVDGGQQHDHELLAHEGDDNQTNHPDNMQVDASIATYHDSAGLRVDARSWPSGRDLEDFRVQQFHGTRAEGFYNASYPQSNEICEEDMVTAMEDGNMDGLSVVSTSLEGVPSSTGRNRANLGDGYQQPFATDGSISVESSVFYQEDFDLRKMKECEQDAENLLDSYIMPNPEGGVAEVFTASIALFTPYLDLGAE